MPIARTAVLGLGVTVGSILLAHAAGPSLDVKTGLWEITSIGATTGAPPIPPEALAQMTPEQRAKMESAMRAAIARNNQSHVSKSCITQRQLEKAPDFAEQHDKSCKQTVVTRTAAVVETRVECSGPQKRSGTFRFQALSRETIRGEVSMVLSGGDKTMTSKFTLDGKWLGADCGNVKPSGG
jgi:uncharacterized protein DUF3617